MQTRSDTVLQWLCQDLVGVYCWPALAALADMRIPVMSGDGLGQFPVCHKNGAALMALGIGQGAFGVPLRKSFKNQIDLLITGGAQPNFGPVHLNKIEINLPASKNEQIRIATALTDMDAEIEQLETKLEKAKKVKQGMLQELLTGKTRLV